MARQEDGRRRAAARGQPAPERRPARPPREPAPPARPARKKRRAARERALRRRRAAVVFSFLTVLAVLTAAFALCLTVLFQISEISVTGTSRYSEEEILSACPIRPGENLFLADTAAAGEQIEQTLPYIGTATVSRRLPANLVIEVQETAAIGAIQYQNGYAVVSSSGKMLEFAASPPDGCPAILGLALSSAEPGKAVAYEDERQYRTFASLAAALESSGLSPVTQLDLSDPLQVLVEYDGRITLKLGLPQELDAKLRFAKEILSRGDMQDEKGQLDLSGFPESDRAFFDEDTGVSLSQVVPAPESSAAAQSAAPESAG